MCQFLAFFNLRHLERFSDLNDLLTLLTIADQLRQIEAFYLAFFWSLHIFCFEHVVARRGGFLLEASVSADYCLVSQKLFRPL